MENTELNIVLNKICKVPKIRDLILSYVQDLDKTYENKSFSKEDFETLFIHGKEVQQDVVLSLFKDKTEVSAGELFTELLKTNVKKINYSSRIKNFLTRNSNVLGVFDIEKQTINLARLPKTLLPNDEDFKATIYHELSHIFECKTFANRKYKKISINNSVIFKTFFRKILLIKNEITNTRIEEAKSKKFDGTSISNTLILNGSSAISEILNEVFSTELFKKPEIVDGITYEKPFASKKKLFGDCFYNRNYDVVEFFKLATGEENFNKFRFNSKKFMEKINSLNIPKEKLSQIQEEFIKISQVPPNRRAEFTADVKSKGNYDTLCLILGSANRFVLSDKFFDNKILAQSLLLEGIKGKIEQDFQNPDIKKDKAFYVNLDKQLTTIDSFLYNKITQYGSTGNCTQQDFITNILPLENIAKSKHTNLSLQSFYDIVKLVEKLSQSQDKKIVLPYLEKQKQIGEKLESENILVREPLTPMELAQRKRALKILQGERVQ